MNNSECSSEFNVYSEEYMYNAKVDTSILVGLSLAMLKFNVDFNYALFIALSRSTHTNFRQELMKV